MRRTTPTQSTLTDWVVGGQGIARRVSVPSNVFLGASSDQEVAALQGQLRTIYSKLGLTENTDFVFDADKIGFTQTGLEKMQAHIAFLTELRTSSERSRILFRQTEQPTAFDVQRIAVLDADIGELDAAINEMLLVFNIPPRNVTLGVAPIVIVLIVLGAAAVLGGGGYLISAYKENPNDIRNDKIKAFEDSANKLASELAANDAKWTPAQKELQLQKIRTEREAADRAKSFKTPSEEWAWIKWLAYAALAAWVWSYGVKGYGSYAKWQGGRVERKREVGRALLEADTASLEADAAQLEVRKKRLIHSAVKSGLIRRGEGKKIADAAESEEQLTMALAYETEMNKTLDKFVPCVKATDGKFPRAKKGGPGGRTSTQWLTVYNACARSAGLPMKIAQPRGGTLTASQQQSNADFNKLMKAAEVKGLVK